MDELTLDELELREDFFKVMRRTETLDWPTRLEILEQFCREKGFSMPPIPRAGPGVMSVGAAHPPLTPICGLPSSAASAPNVSAFDQIFRKLGVDAMLAEYRRIRSTSDDQTAQGIDRQVCRELFSVAFQTSRYSEAVELFDIILQHYAFDFLSGLQAAEALMRVGDVSRGNTILDRCANQIRGLNADSKQRYLVEIEKIRSLAEE